MFCYVGGGMLLAFITGKNRGEEGKEDFHVRGLIGIHNGTAGCSESFGKGMEIGPEGRAPFGGLLDKKRRGHFFSSRLSFTTTITGHFLSKEVVPF